MKKTQALGIVILASVAVAVLTVGCDSIADVVPLVGEEPDVGPTVTPYVPPATDEPPAAVEPTAAPPTAEPPPQATAEVPTATSPPVTVLVAPPADVADWPQEVARLINEARGQQGLSPLSYYNSLAQAAQSHANDCSQRGSCSSTGSDGSDLDTRLLRVGYQPAAADQSWAMSTTPSEAVDWWMTQSPPDDWPRRLILSETYTQVGIGLAPASWGYYIVLVFARP